MYNLLIGLVLFNTEPFTAAYIPLCARKKGYRFLGF